MHKEGSSLEKQSDLKQINASITNLLERETKDKNNRLELRRKIQQGYL